MHPALSASLSVLLVDRRDGHRRAVLDLFQQRAQADFYSRELLEQRRDEQLAALLAHARAQVPRFRELLGAHPAPEPARVMDVLRRLPVMRRSDIQAQPAAFVAEDAAGAMDDFTGGSTGTPLCFKVDRETQRAREATLYWANSLAGWRYGERVAMLWGSDRDVKHSLRDVRAGLRWQLDNMRWFNAFDMGPDRMREFHRDLARFRPHLVVAYAGSVHTFAHFLRDLGGKPSYPLRGIVSSAEVLTPAMRADVEQVFGRPVFDRYGNREAGAIAAECEAHQGLHLNETDFVVEVDSRDPTQVPGPILITFLRNRAMPLIRYDTGDLGLLRPGACPCGRTTLRLASVVGRQSDTIRTAHGKLIHGEYFTHVLYGAAGVRNFQFVQESLQDYRLLLEMSGPPAPEQIAAWKDKILNALGPGNRLEVERVDQIPVLPSGKRRFTLSKLPTGG
jgi:phenylacetate-CoA ligase